MVNKKIKTFIDKLSKTRNVLLCAHKNPDGDALCSVLALAHLIELNLGYWPLCVYEGNIPDCLDYVPFRDKIRYFPHMTFKKPFDVVMLLDYGTEKNLGSVMSVIETAKFKIEIDHHINPEPIADLCFDDTSAAAVGEIIFRLMIDCKWKYDDKILDLLAVSIITDTGFFKYVNNGDVLRIMGQLVDWGVNINRLEDSLNNKPCKTVKTESLATANAELFMHNTVAVAVIPHKEYKNLDGRGEITLNLLRQIKGVEYIVLLKEQRENQIGVSLRCRTKTVENIAAQLGGGGHAQAAGAVVYDTLENTRNRVLQLIKEAK